MLKKYKDTPFFNGDVFINFGEIKAKQIIIDMKKINSYEENVKFKNPNEFVFNIRHHYYIDVSQYNYKNDCNYNKQIFFECIDSKLILYNLQSPLFTRKKK